MADGRSWRVLGCEGNHTLPQHLGILGNGTRQPFWVAVVVLGWSQGLVLYFRPSLSVLPETQLINCCVLYVLKGEGEEVNYGAWQRHLSCPTILRKTSFLRKAVPSPSCQCWPTHLKVMMLGCLSFRKCLISVSLRTRTFLTATSSPWKRPRKTAPWAPLPTHCKSMISSKGTSHGSAWRGKESGSHGLSRGKQTFHPQGKNSCITSSRNNWSYAYCRNTANMNTAKTWHSISWECIF